MTVYEKGLATVLAVDALFVLVSIPLALRRVGPNPWYGYRTPATLRDGSVWYEANAFFAHRLVGGSLVSALAALFLLRPGLFAPDAVVPVPVVLIGVPVAVAGVLTSRFVGRIAPR